MVVFGDSEKQLDAEGPGGACRYLKDVKSEPIPDSMEIIVQKISKRKPKPNSASMMSKNPEMESENNPMAMAGSHSSEMVSKDQSQDVDIMGLKNSIDDLRSMIARLI